MQLATCLLSLVESNRSSWPLDIRVLVDNFPEELREKVRLSLPNGSASIEWIEIDVRSFDGFATAHYISRMTFARFLIPSVLPETVSRAVYLDADTLVLGDLSPLWNVDLDDYPTAAVLDGLDKHIRANTPGFEDVPRVKRYFNAGMLAIDVKKWRDTKLVDDAHRYLLANPKTPYSDQDALNVVCDGQWKELDSRWNFQGHLHCSVGELPAEEMPAIVHFVTALKPWKPEILNPNASLYDSFRRRTYFARTSVQVLRDTVVVSWCKTRRYFGRFAVLRSLRNWLVSTWRPEPSNAG